MGVGCRFKCAQGDRSVAGAARSLAMRTEIGASGPSASFEIEAGLRRRKVKKMSRSLRVLFWVIFVGALFLVSQSKYRPEISDWGRIIACVAIFVGMLLSHRDDKQSKPGNVLFLSGLGTLLLINLGSSF